MAVPGIAEDYDVLVETDATGFYHLVVDRRLEGVRIDGDAAALDQLLDGFAASPLPSPEDLPGVAHVGLGRAGVADCETERVAPVQLCMRDKELAEGVDPLEQRLVLLVAAVAAQLCTSENGRGAVTSQPGSSRPSLRRAPRARSLREPLLSPSRP